MYLILENDEITNKWRQVPGTTAYDSQEEALEIGKEMELFDTIIVKFERFV